MAIQLQLRRGTTAENDAFTGAVGEMSYDTDTNGLRIHDGNTQGGFKVDTVVEFQAPTAQNNYTWYTKYADGRVEQGGIAPFRDGTITLVVAMADDKYSISHTPVVTGTLPSAAGIAPYVHNVTTTSFGVYNNVGSETRWEVKGLAA